MEGSLRRFSELSLQNLSSLNPCSDGRLSERPSWRSSSPTCLNPCSDGRLSENRQWLLQKLVRSCSLNPCSDGRLSEKHVEVLGHVVIWRAGLSKSLFWWKALWVYPTSLPIERNVRLNPCSDGRLSEYRDVRTLCCLASCLNPCSDGRLSETLVGKWFCVIFFV